MSEAENSASIAGPLRKQVFVAYSYRLYPKADYRKIFKQLEEKYDVTFIFADEKITNMHIMKKIESFIRGSDFSIFDISGWNPNVTLELGFAMAVNDQWYIVVDPQKTEIKEVPSDLRGLDRIEYESYTDLGYKLGILLQQRYPERKRSGIEDYLRERQDLLIEILREHPGQNMASIAQLLEVEVPIAQMIVKRLFDKALIEMEEKRRYTQYFLKGQAPHR